MSLEKLEEKIESKKNEVVLTDTDRIISEIKRIYRLVSNTTNRIEKQLSYIEHKQNNIIDLLKTKDINIDEIKRLQEIAELEKRLKELKGES